MLDSIFRKMSGMLLKDWFENILVPKLITNNIIVLDNAPKKISNSAGTATSHIQKLKIFNNFLFII